MTVNSRKIALDALIDFEKNNTYLNLTLNKYLQKVTLQRDKTFISALVYGTVENRNLLDYYISGVSSVKLKKINKVVLNILRLGLYQLLFMSVPVSAACNTSVELAKTNGQYKSSGFVNAILRKLSIKENLKQLPSVSTDEYYKIKYSLSDSVFEALSKTLGLKRLEEFFDNGKLCLDDYYAAVNTHKIDAQSLLILLNNQGVNATTSDIEGLIKINGSFDVQNNNCFKEGLCHIIGYPSFITARTMQISNNQTAIDMCSCPGGKTMTVSYHSDKKSRIYAFDYYENKISLFKQRLLTYGLKNIIPTVKDGTVYDDTYEQSADKVLCDVPCSCLGMIFKKPDIKFSQIDFETLIETQKKILDNAARYVKKGGRLVYSTCTVNSQENEGNVKRFLSKHTEFVIDNECEIIKGVFGTHLFMPCDKFAEAFYIAVLKRVN